MGVAQSHSAARFVAHPARELIRDSVRMIGLHIAPYLRCMFEKFDPRLRGLDPISCHSCSTPKAPGDEEPEYKGCGMRQRAGNPTRNAGEDRHRHGLAQARQDFSHSLARNPKGRKANEPRHPKRYDLRHAIQRAQRLKPCRK